MGRYDKYKQAVMEEQAFREEQKRLHKQHEQIEEDTVIIETPNMTKFLLRYLRWLMRTLFGVLLILLATAGLLTLLHPDSREAFFGVLQMIVGNLQELIGKEWF